LADSKQINAIEDNLMDESEGYYAAETLMNDLNHDSFFMLRGESVIYSNHLDMTEADFNIDLLCQDDFFMYHVVMKPRGSAVKKLFGSNYVEKDFYVYRDGALIIRDRARSETHAK
jgi:hypothetical protein